MDEASPNAAGTDQMTTCDAESVDFTGATGFKWDWKPTAKTAAAERATPISADARDRRYRDPGHPSATGDGRP